MKNVAVITGAAGGLGIELSKILAKNSYSLICIDIDKVNLEKAKKEISEKYNCHVTIIEMDLAKNDAAIKVYELISKYDIEVLINNAGFGIRGKFTDTDWILEEAMINLHVFTVTHLTKLVLKDMVRKGKGSIMNIASIAAFQPGPLKAIYHATKSYIVSFGSALSSEIKGTGVFITTVCPGVIRTNFSETLAKISNAPVYKGSTFSADPEKVARISFKAMTKGKSLVIPIFVNKVLICISRLIPLWVSAMIVKRINENI